MIAASSSLTWECDTILTPAVVISVMRDSDNISSNERKTF